MDSGQPLDGLVGLNQGIQESHKPAGGLRVMHDLIAGIKEKTGDGDGAQHFHDRGGRCLGPHPSQTDAQQPPRGRLEFLHFKQFHSKSFHNADSGERLL